MSFVASCEPIRIALPGVKIYSACSADYTVVTSLATPDYVVTAVVL